MKNKTYNIDQLRSAWGAGKYSSVEINGKSSSGLIGKYFHSFKDGELNWQGQIKSTESDNYFSVITYSWIDGREYSVELVKFEEMIDWEFYPTLDEMKERYKQMKDVWLSKHLVKTGQGQK